MEAVFEHAVERYGVQEVGTWLWEVWNEPGPNGGQYYRGTEAEFVALAEQVYLAAERVEKKYGVDLKMGLCSSGIELSDAVAQRLYELGKLDMVDHVSVHGYAGAMAPATLLTDQIPDLRRRYTKRYPRMKPYQVGCTEWNASSMGGELCDRPWNATLAVKCVRLMLDAGLDYGAFFTLIDHPALKPRPPLFAGYLGMITKQVVAKPVYHSFAFLKELKGGRRLAVESSNDPIDGLAVVQADGTVRMVLTSYDEDTSRQPYETQVTVEIGGIGSCAYECTRHWAVDERHGNAYGKWIELGRPHTADEAEFEAFVTEHQRLLAPTPVRYLPGVAKSWSCGRLSTEAFLAQVGVALESGANGLCIFANWGMTEADFRGLESL